MKESQIRIKEYSARLPKLKEQLVAVLLLLAVSASMLVTVSFAWLSISTNPEVSGVSTSIASNGNLEIALATGTITNSPSPDASKVGDGKLGTLEMNHTWGNIINLSDPAYGLDKLVLRPALLNESDLTKKPLYGPIYDETGRVEALNTQFGYSAWNPDMMRFDASDKLGIRAITSMTLGESGDAALYNQKLGQVEALNFKLQTSYQNIAYNDTYMSALSSMMAGYMVKNVFKKNDNLSGMIKYASLAKKDLEQFVDMYNALIDSFEEQAVVFAELLNLQNELEAKASGSASFKKISGTELLALSFDTKNKTAYNYLKNQGYEAATGGFIQEIDQFLYDYNILITDITKVQEICDQISSSVTWDETSVPTAKDGSTLDTLISRLVNVNNCTITGGDYTNLKISSIGGTAALNLLGAGVCQTYITNGILFNFDNRSGARLKNKSGKPLTLSVKTSMGNQSITSNVATSATKNYFDVDRVALAKVIDTQFGELDEIASDSYGFAVDFWVRTNAEGSYLTLQGNVLTESEVVKVKGKDQNGKEVQLYTITVEVETEGETTDNGGLNIKPTITYDIYASTTTDEEGNEINCWRFADNHSVVEDEYINAQTPKEKVKTVEHVIGFEGDNRVWNGDKHSMLSVNSTTQGSGSCYVFYTNNPVEQARSLKLLKSMRIAFVDANGELLAIAIMDTERCYASSGKVIVPLVLDSSRSVNIGNDEAGNPIYAITALERNVATRITAIVYLEGTDLTNEDVLASADIEGKMNIQFGSSCALYALDNEELYNAQLFATATLENTVFEYGVDNKMTTGVKVTVSGSQPSSVTANFIRRINSTQGSPEDTFILTDTDGDGVWEGEYTFLYPGEYIIRSVQIDGTDRELTVSEGSDFPTVTVKGFTIERVTYNLTDFVMTDASTYTGSINLKFAASDPAKMPKTVVGQFLRDDGAAVDVKFTYDATTTSWNGNARFISSGEYTMRYAILDGQYVELPEAQRFTIDLTLGMRVQIETTSPTYMIYGDENAPSTLKVNVKVLDNNGDIIPSLANVSIYYSMGGSNQLYAGLIYDSVSESYEGEFKTQAGTWKFSHVNVRMGEFSNTLTSSNSDAPVFTIVPPTPPSYVSNSGDTTDNLIVKYADKADNATVVVTLKESGAATVYAKFVKVDENGNLVSGTAPKYIKQYGDMYTTAGFENGAEVTYYNYRFQAPSGIWKLESISVYDVFDNNMTLHAQPEDCSVDTEEEYLQGIVFDETENSAFKPVTTVILYKDSVTVSTSYNESAFTSLNKVGNTAYFGKDYVANTVNGVFMQNHTIQAGGINIVIKDTENLLNTKYFDISNVKFDYSYGSSYNDATYGGYTSSDFAQTIQNGLSFATLNFSAMSGSKTNFALDSAISFQYAAKYVPSQISYDVTAKDGTKSSEKIACDGKSRGEYTIEVWSKAPTVAITGAYHGSSAISSSGKVHKAYDGSKLIDQTSKWNSNEATVYYVASEGGSCTKYYNYTPAKVQITLNGMGNADSAALTFTGGNNNKFYSAPETFGEDSITTGESNSFTWSSDGNAWRWIGYCKNKNLGDERTAAGSKTATQLTFTYNGKNYTFDLPTAITINNPY